MKSIKKSFAVIANGWGGLNVSLCGDEAAAFSAMIDCGNGTYIIEQRYTVVDSNEITFRATIIMPIWERPQRTIRAINSVLSQDTNGWQLLCLGDGCNHFARLMETPWFKGIQAKAYIDGNEIVALNTEHYGGYGYHQRQIGKDMARGTYTLFLDNDDVLLPSHLSVRLRYPESSTNPADMYYFDTLLPENTWRDAQLEWGRIGHAEIMINTERLKSLSPTTDQYGHDWTQISEAINKGFTIKKGIGEMTYIVKSMPTIKESGID